MTEEWRSVSGYEGVYEVSDMGRVKSLARSVPHPKGVAWKQERILRPIRHKSGHVSVIFSVNGERKKMAVHRLVLEAFVGPAPAGLWGRHWDDDPTNNSVSNLRWGTPAQNTEDSVRNGSHHQSSKTRCKNGHEFTDENTYRYGRSRSCKTCRAENHRRWRATASSSG